MAVTLADFKVAFPEFDRGADTSFDAYLQARLDDAATVTAASVWGALHQQGVFYRAADDIANGPYGRKMQITIAKDGSTRYSKRLAELKRSAAIGIRAL